MLFWNFQTSEQAAEKELGNTKSQQADHPHTILSYGETGGH